jgi:ABC-type multidrug transport system ATPase subunit
MADEIVDLPPSSRRWPTFRFDPLRDSGKEVLSVKGIRKAFGENEVLHGVDLTVDRGDRLAILGPNGIGKSTLLKILMGRLQPDAGEVKWGYETHVGYFAQDFRDEFSGDTATAEEWIWARCPGKDRGFVRGRLGLVLFSGEDGLKKLESLSGGEAARLVFARVGLERPNVLVLDEPTNHLDLESIEALVEALASYPGTIIFVSHDRWFVREIATRIVEIRPGGIRDYRGNYEEYVAWCGDDHLDHESVVLKAKREKKDARREEKGKEKGKSNGAQAGGSSTSGGVGKPDSAKNRSGAKARGAGKPGGDGRPKQSGNPRELERRRDDLTAKIEAAEARVAEIDALFCEPGFFEKTPGHERRRLEGEREERATEATRLMARWEALEQEIVAK